jgi:hypothetical protein
MKKRSYRKNPLLDLVKKRVAYLGIDEREARSRLIREAGLARSVVWRFWDGSRINMDNLFTILNFFDLIRKGDEDPQSVVNATDLVIFKKNDLTSEFRFLESLAPAVEHHNDALCVAILKASVDALYKKDFH